MTYASLELCQELYELSDWGTEVQYRSDGHIYTGIPMEAGTIFKSSCPAYDLGYILRKLSAIDDPDNGEPKNISVELSVLDNYAVATACRGITRVDADQPIQRMLPSCDAETPENAAVKLAIALFKQGILTK